MRFGASLLAVAGAVLCGVVVWAGVTGLGWSLPLGFMGIIALLLGLILYSS